MAALAGLEEVKAEPNLTPILDLVFQLITFFMLVINIKNASIDETLKLPVVGSARAVDSNVMEDLLTLNINDKGEIKVYTQVRPMASYIAQEARASVKLAKEKNPNFKVGDEMPTTVVLRIDRNTPFGLWYPILKECQNHKFLKFQIKANNRRPKEEKQA